MNKIIGVGVLLKTNNGTFLFQERDEKANLHPNKIAAFGGGMEIGEDIYECAQRELLEELELIIDKSDLKEIGCFESYHKNNTYIQIFICEHINQSELKLKEGRSIVELSIDEALEHNLVTDFTKTVISSLK